MLRLANYRMMKVYGKFYLPQMMMSASSYVMDLTKDFLIVIQVSIAQGGLEKILRQPQPHMAGVRNS